MIQRSSNSLFSFIGARAFLLLPGFIFALLFGVEILDQGSCEFDWCRFTNPNIVAYFDPDEAYWGTFLMHFIYASNSSVILVRSTIINVIITLIFIPSRATRRELVLLSIACAIPGKEFFLLLGICLIARGLSDFRLPKIVKGCLLISIARPEYIIFLFLAWLRLRLGKVQIFIILIVLLIAFSIFGEHEITHSSLNQKSTLPYVEEFRSLFSGYSAQAAFGKITLYFAYLSALPLFDLTRILLTPNEGYIILFYSFSISSWIFAISGCKLKTNIQTFFFTALVTGIFSPFVHIRWAIPLLCFMSLIENNRSNYSDINFKKTVFCEK